MSEVHPSDLPHFWQLAMEGSNDGFWDWDVQTGAVNYSLRWKAILGFGDDEVEDTIDSFRALVHPDDLERVQLGMAHHFEVPQAAYTAEFRMRCKDGGYKWIFSRGVAQRDENGRVLRMAGSHTDITERKAHEQELEEALAQVQSLRNAMVRMCAWTKKVNHEGEWISVEEFLSRTMGAKISHGMSDEAVEKMKRETAAFAAITG